MEQIGYTTVNRILSKLRRDLNMDSLHEADVIEWTGEALEAIDAVTMLEECVSFIEVENYEAEMPKYLDSIIQIARNNEWEEGATNESCAPIEVAESLCEGTPDECDEVPCEEYKCILVDETGTPIYTKDLYEYKPNINVIAEYFNWVSSDYYLRKWTPVRLKNNSFFNSVVCKEMDYKDIYQNSQDEYNVVANKILRFSFKSGYIAISYLRPMLDEEGYPMIPDHYAFTTAVTKYITMKIMERNWYSGREGYDRKVQKAEADWHWYCKQAGNRSIIPRGTDQYQNMLDTSQYLLPRIHRYNQFFMDLSRMENRVYNDPGYRNTHHNRR